MSRYAVYSVCIIAVCAAATACSRDSLEVTPEEEEWVSTVGHEAANSLSQGLVARLLEAIEEDGTSGAVDVCSNEALQLTAEIQQQIAPGHQEFLADVSAAFIQQNLFWSGLHNFSNEWASEP